MCATVDADQHPDLLAFFDVQPHALPALVVLDKAANRRYPLHAPPTDGDVIEAHVRAVLAGALTLTLTLTRRNPNPT